MKTIYLYDVLPLIKWLAVAILVFVGIYVGIHYERENGASRLQPASIDETGLLKQVAELEAEIEKLRGDQQAIAKLSIMRLVQLKDANLEIGALKDGKLILTADNEKQLRTLKIIQNADRARIPEKTNGTPAATSTRLVSRR